MKKLLPFILIIAAFIAVVVIIASNKLLPSWVQNDVFTDAKKNECQKLGNTWLDAHNECEFNYVDTNSEEIFVNYCKKNKGEYIDCGSGCRHIPEAQACLAVCIPFCKF